MKRYKPFWIPLAWIFCLTATHLAVHAEFRTPEQIVAEFNGNWKTLTLGQHTYEWWDGCGYSTPARPGDPFTDTTLRRLVFEHRETYNVDVSAYDQKYGGTDDGIWINTFRCTRSETDLRNGIAWLSYDPLSGGTYLGRPTDIPNAGTRYLTLGAAYLYARFVQGKLQDINENVADFRRALDRLYIGTSNSDDLWNVNPYLCDLISITPRNTAMGAKDYWCQAYNLQYDYLFMDGLDFGNLYIFVMNVVDIVDYLPDDAQYAAMLYAAPRYSDPPPVQNVPEPATLLLWTLGGLGLSGTSWLRRRHKKKVVSA